MKNDLILFEDYKVRRLYDEGAETWYFSVIDIVQILTQQPEFQTARNYWNVLKTRLNKEGSQSLTNCKQRMARNTSRMLPTLKPYYD